MAKIPDQLKDVYLGDGLYASFNGFEFMLRAPREGGDHWVALEPSVLRNFDQYRETIQKWLASGTDIQER